MADAAIEFLLSNLKDLLLSYTNQLTQGQEVVSWIDYELETLIPQLDRIEAKGRLPPATEVLTRSTRDVIRKAEDLAANHTKMKILQIDHADSLRAIFYDVKIWKISKQLHGIKAKISDCREGLLRNHNVLLAPDSAASEEQSAIPPYLRRCLLYFLLFPSGYPVPARRLVVLWVAEGLVHSKNHDDDDDSTEQIAHGYLNDLRRLGLIRVEERRSGKLTCSIDASRREALMKEAEEAEFLQVKNTGNIRRLVDHNGSAAAKSFIYIQGNTATFDSSVLPNYRDVISFLSFNGGEGSKPGEDIGDFLRRCISRGCFLWLRVLDLEGVFRPKLPEKLGKLIAIKYLGLRWTYLEILPDSVDKLFNLQVLDVKHTYISVLPRSLWRMQYLRHLYLSEAYRTRFPRPPSQVNLSDLQTLWGAFVDEDTPVVGGLDQLLGIRKLALSCRSSGAIESTKPVTMEEQMKAIEKWIANLEFLESLRLKSRGEDNKAAHLRLASLKGNRRLTTVYLLGKLESVILCKLPVSLTSITLSGSELDVDPLEFLGKLPNLLILRLLGQSVVCSSMYCSKRSFQKLKLLWIWKLEKLEDFGAEEGSMPCLEEFEIRECRRLEALPRTRLSRVQNLEIKLTKMPLKIVDEARSIYANVTDVNTFN